MSSSICSYSCHTPISAPAPTPTPAPAPGPTPTTTPTPLTLSSSYLIFLPFSSLPSTIFSKCLYYAVLHHNALLCMSLYGQWPYIDSSTTLMIDPHSSLAIAFVALLRILYKEPLQYIHSGLKETVLIMGFYFIGRDV